MSLYIDILNLFFLSLALCPNYPFVLKYYAKLACSSQGGLKIAAFSDEYCSQEISANIGLYNDVKVRNV